MLKKTPKHPLKLYFY